MVKKNRWIEIFRCNKVAWICVFVLMILTMVSMNFNDFYTTVRTGINVWEAIKDGAFLDFYAYSEPGMPGNIWTSYTRMGSGAASYDATIYLVFAVWNLPLWVYEQVTGANAFDNFALLIYSKALLFLLLVLTAHYSAKIFRLIKGDQVSEENAFLLSFFSSALLITYTLLTGNYDVLELVMMVAGTYYFLQNKLAPFLVLYSFAISIKYLPLFAFGYLIVFRYKKIHQIIGCLLAGSAVTIIEKLTFRPSAHRVMSSTEPIYSGFSFMMNPGIHVAGVQIPIYPILYVAFGMYIWICWKKDEQLVSRTLYISLLPYLVLYLLSEPHPQWIVLVVPFALLLWYYQDRLFKWNAILGLVYTATLLLRQMLFYHWVFAHDNFTGYLFYHLIGRNQMERRNVLSLGYSMPDVLKIIQARVDYSLLIGIINIAAGTILLFINYPGFSDRFTKPMIKGKTPQKKVIVWHNIFMWAMILAPIMLYVAEMLLYAIR